METKKKQTYIANNHTWQIKNITFDGKAKGAWYYTFGWAEQDTGAVNSGIGIVKCMQGVFFPVFNGG